MGTDFVPPVSLGAADVAAMIDHSLLRPELTSAEVAAGCELAASYAVASVCVRPADVAAAAALLAGTPVEVGTVVGFPHGSNATATKAAEARQALADGARELDMVLNIGRLRSGEHAAVGADVAAVVAAARGEGALVKVILENAYLTDEEIVTGCRLVEEAGADFVKTSTGFAPGGAVLEQVALMRRSVGEQVGVKAAGGVRTLDALLRLVAVGATRFGATATAAMLDDARARTAGHGAIAVPQAVIAR
ncbi:deoxyribose-phosphate aldolase [Streptacidiphilus sp. ASG 303]|uniref:deoxyribose-phosphate aldolase n=1 Tax=Streptacidiphilus sp. ASG 303 TaxID=2896847 RepID=UPI001E39B5B5|nr:deoxyribose-phosphate aldolase [Streptacidiphilus sp. ASG 303]MCD0483581.1 deoxyribose-phosphate aldolase [Streptacidiphilus sp. ASG 303]